MQMPGITSGCRRKLKNALSYFEENTKSWNEKEKWLRANERVIKKYHTIEKRMIITGKTFDRFLGGKVRGIAPSYFTGGEPWNADRSFEG